MDDESVWENNKFISRNEKVIKIYLLLIYFMILTFFFETDISHYNTDLKSYFTSHDEQMTNQVLFLKPWSNMDNCFVQIQRYGEGVGQYFWMRDYCVPSSLFFSLQWMRFMIGQTERNLIHGNDFWMSQNPYTIQTI